MSSLVSVYFFGNSIEGVIPSSISKLCNLEYFQINSNILRGSLPESLEETINCHSENQQPSLKLLYLSYNQRCGKIPEWLGQLKNLVDLDLSHTSLEGSISTSLWSLANLSFISLRENQLNGALPISLGQISKLSILDVSYNLLTGLVSEAHFSKLNNLEILDLSSNSFTLKVSPNWVPPFQVNEPYMGSYDLGPSFPGWLNS